MKKLLGFSLAFLGFLVIPSVALAVCPICTVAVGAGLGVSRALGIDDAVTSVWIGGLIVSISFWTVDWLKKKDFKFIKDLKESTLLFVSTFVWTIFTIVPLYSWKYIGRVGNSLWGVDKIIVGTVVGFLVFLLAVYLDKKVREVKGKQLFNYQKVVFPVILLLISSFVMYLLTK